MSTPTRFSTGSIQKTVPWFELERLGGQLLDQRGERREAPGFEAVAEVRDTRTVREQIAHRDRLAGGAELIWRRLDARMREFGDEWGDGIAKSVFPLFEQHEARVSPWQFNTAAASTGE